jgi:uncharacterized protein involved in exopolysaccharide biosynthesis
VKDYPDVTLIGADAEADDDGIDLLDLLLPLAAHAKILIAGTLTAGLAALAATYVVRPTYTARTAILPPQQQQSTAAAALASLGALAGLVGSSASIKSPADQYVALMRSTTVADRLVDRFRLQAVYDVQYRIDARKELADNVRVSVGKKDGMITLEVDDTDPRRAAEMANVHVEELRRLTDQLALSEAQQRRKFFEVQLHQTRERLTQAQQALQASGFTAGALRAEPKAAAEEYARLKAEATAVEVRLQTLRRGLAEDTPEVQQQRATLAALRSQLARAELATDTRDGPDYVGRYREFKYQETLFELFAKQYELARVDESREGALIQVVDPATPPEKRSSPKRTLTAMVAAFVGLLGLSAAIVVRHLWRLTAMQPRTARKLERLRGILRAGRS